MKRQACGSMCVVACCDGALVRAVLLRAAVCALLVCCERPSGEQRALSAVTVDLMNRNMRHLFGTCPPNTGGVAQLRSRSAVNKGQIAASRSSNRNDATGIRDTTKSATATLDKVRRHV